MMKSWYYDDINKFTLFVNKHYKNQEALDKMVEGIKATYTGISISILFNIFLRVDMKALSTFQEACR